jgi:hypothetical protein
MTDEAQTEAIPRVPTALATAGEPEVAQPDTEAADARTECVQEMYEAGLAKLNALHDRWGAAVAEIREAQAGNEPDVAAA